MAWSLVKQIRLSKQWQFTEPVEGEFFRFKQVNPLSGSTCLIAQVQQIEEEYDFFDFRIIEAGDEQRILQLKKPGVFASRRIALRKLPKADTLEEQLRRAISETFLREPQRKILSQYRANWQIDIEVSDYVTPASGGSTTGGGTTGGGTTGGGTTGGSTAPSYVDRILALQPFIYYRFEETGGVQATDSSGNNRHGTYNNCELGHPGSLASLPNTKSVLSKNSSSVVPGHSAFPLPQKYTIFFRFKLQPGTSYSGFACFADNTSGMPSGRSGEIFWYMGKITFQSVSLYNNAISTPSKDYADNQWHSVAAQLTPTAMKLFVDGQMVASKTIESNPSFNCFFRVGDVYGFPWQGALDEAGFIASDVSDTKILEIHQAAL